MIGPTVFPAIVDATLRIKASSFLIDGEGRDRPRRREARREWHGQQAPVIVRRAGRLSVVTAAEGV